MSDRDVDAQFADIIAHWDDPVTPPQPGVSPQSPYAAEPAGPQTEPDSAGAGSEEPGIVEPDSVEPGGVQRGAVPADGDTRDGDAADGGAADGGAPASGTGAASTPGPADQSGTWQPPRPRAVDPAPQLGGIPVWRGPTGSGVRKGDGGSETADDLDDDEHFEPGPTAPLPPQEDLHFWGIVVGLVAGPLLLLWLVIFRPGVSDWWTLLALGLTVGGFILLVLRQPRSRDEDDPDNGARV